MRTAPSDNGRLMIKISLTCWFYARLWITYCTLSLQRTFYVVGLPSTTRAFRSPHDIHKGYPWSIGPRLLRPSTTAVVTMSDSSNLSKSALVSLFVESIIFGESDSAWPVSPYSNKKYSGLLTILFTASSYILIWKKKKLQCRDKVILTASVVMYLLAIMVDCNKHRQCRVLLIFYLCWSIWL